MEVLRVLEEKIAQLVESKKQDLELIAKLRSENQVLTSKVIQLEEALCKNNESTKDLDDEREMTKMAVDELIQHIDTLLEKELQA